jgi:tRNA(adenine34) deaminase
MQEALAQADEGLEANDVPIGAVAALHGAVLSATHWRYRPTALLDHADILALREAERDPRLKQHPRRAVTLYVTMEPCLMCIGAAMSFGVGRVVFALEAPMDGASAVTELWEPALGHAPAGYQVYSRPTIVAGVCRDEALDQMRRYVERNPNLEWAKAMLPGFRYQDAE